MSQTLRTAAIIVGAVALVATGVGAIAGAAAVGGTAIGAASAATLASIAATATTIASIATVAAAGLSVAAQVTARPPPLGGSATKFKADKDAGLPYVIGRTATGGNIVYRRTHNTTGYSLPDLQTFVAILSCAGPVQAIESFAADRAPVSFSGGVTSGGYATWMFQTQQLGASPEAAALSTAGLFVSSGKTTSAAPSWGGATKLSGFAAAMWTLRYDQKGKFYANGVPQPLWVVQGVKVYDPRLDSTYPGGSGACRSNNEATFVYSENPYLHGLTFALGRYQNGKRVIGIGAPIGGIDVRAFVEGANVADANGWKAGGVPTSKDNKWGVLKSILQAGGGEPMHLGALLSCTVQTPRVALATVTTDDLIGEARVTATTSRRDRFNTVVPRYRSEAHDWEVIPAAPVTVSAHVTTDGGLRSREITYSMVQGLNQAAALARYDIENAREFGPVVLPLKLRWLGYRPGDCIRVELPEVGLNGQDIIIGNREIDAAALGVTLTARSETFGKHAFALGQTGVAPPTASVSTQPVPPQPGAVAWSLSGAGLVQGATVTPALIITGAAADVPIDAVVIEYRLWVPGQAADVGWIGNGSYLPDVARIEITAVKPSTAYEVAVSYRLGAFTGARRILGPVTTSADVAGSAATAPWSGVINDDGTIPADNATRNDDPQNLIFDPVNGSAIWGSTGAVLRIATSWASAPFSVEIAGNAFASYSDANDTSRYLPIRGGETIYTEVLALSDASTTSAGTLTTLLNVFDSAKNYITTLALTGDSFSRALYPVDGVYPVRAANTLAEFYPHFSTGVPTRVAYVWPHWLVSGHTGGTIVFHRPYVGRVQNGATLGAKTRRLLGQFFAGGAQQVYSVNPITATSSAITIAGHDVSDDVGAISYAGGSISGVSASTFYYVYQDDPAYAGGTLTYAATTSYAALATAGRRLVGTVTTPASGTVSGGGAGPGGGGGGGGYPLP